MLVTQSNRSHMGHSWNNSVFLKSLLGVSVVLRLSSHITEHSSEIFSWCIHLINKRLYVRSLCPKLLMGVAQKKWRLVVVWQILIDEVWLSFHRVIAQGWWLILPWSCFWAFFLFFIVHAGLSRLYHYEQWHGSHLHHSKHILMFLWSVVGP